VACPLCRLTGRSLFRSGEAYEGALRVGEMVNDRLGAGEGRRSVRRTSRGGSRGRSYEGRSGPLGCDSCYGHGHRWLLRRLVARSCMDGVCGSDDRNWNHEPEGVVSMLLPHPQPCIGNRIDPHPRGAGSVTPSLVLGDGQRSR
jgi:hypothetical protein